jgi:GNAT superfamily N-acetyltransferase
VTGREPAGGGEPVTDAGRADLDVLGQLIADAFHPLAVSEWLIGDPQARREIFPGYFRIFAEHALRTGTVHTTPGRTAVALWFPVRGDGPAAPDGYAAQLAAVTGPWLDRFRALDDAFDQHHPRGLLHHHLGFLAVRPDQQGRGLGTGLLREHHGVLDVTGLPAYLEASGPDTRQFYLRHGYADHGGPIRLPDGPLMYPMLRHPARM